MNCRASKGQETQRKNTSNAVNEILTYMGYDTSGEVPVWIQFHQRHNLPIKNKDL
jgi:hypothetical protein